jgi:pyruvate formate lyase activating enzyme
MDFVGLEKFSLVDYEGKISATLFFKGCNFKCPFCHNSSLVYLNDGSQAIPFSDILDFLKKRRGIIDAVVISGGEATLMDDLKDKIKQIKELGYLIKLDTNGTTPEVLEDLIKSNLIDYVAMDIKNSFDKYDLTAGVKVNIENIKKSISIIINSDIAHEFRTTLVKEFHTLEDIKNIASMLKYAKKYRLQKFVLNENCINKDLHEVDINTAKLYLEEIKKTINDSSLRGY